MVKLEKKISASKNQHWSTPNVSMFSRVVISEVQNIGNKIKTKKCKKHGGLLSRNCCKYFQSMDGVKAGCGAWNGQEWSSGKNIQLELL